MKLTELSNPSDKTSEYLLEAFDMRFNFQVFDGKIEHVNDYEFFGWSIGKTMDKVVQWAVAKEKEHEDYLADAEKRKKELPSIMKQRQLLWEEENKKRKAWEADHYTEGEKGEGWFH